MQHLANDSEPALGGIRDAGVGRRERGAAQDRQRLGCRLPQDHFAGDPRHHVGQARGFAPVGRRRRPDPLDIELPFPELAVHVATPALTNTTGAVKLSVSAGVILN